MRTIETTLVTGAVVLLSLSAARPAAAQDPLETPTVPLAGGEAAAQNGAAAPADTRTRHFHLGVGIVPLVWIPDNKELSIRLEVELRWTPAAPWSVVGDVSYIQIGEAGSRKSEDGIGLFAGGMHAWAVGDAATATLFPHVRAGLAFEATSTRLTTSSKHIALRAGPGIDWNAFGGALVNAGLEIGFGLLSTKAGSASDSARAEITLGLAVRLLWGF